MDGVGGDNDDVVDKDDKAFHLHDLHFLNQVVFLSLCSILLKKVKMIKKTLAFVSVKHSVKQGVVENYVPLIEAPRNPFGFLPLNPLQFGLPRLSCRKHISICSDWFWLEQARPPVGLNAFLIDSPLLGHLLPSSKSSSDGFRLFHFSHPGIPNFMFITNRKAPRVIRLLSHEK